jgi:excinuclease UvrABC nuclease subunit
LFANLVRLPGYNEFVSVPLEPSLRLQPPFDLSEVPDRPAVFVIHPHAGRPYLGRTRVLRRRLTRLLDATSTLTRRLNLRELAARVDCYYSASQLSARLTHYQLARDYFPDEYPAMIHLRPAAFIKTLLGNQFPRTVVTTRLSGARAFHYGPFRTRASAERFEQEVLDLFQVRRCQEDLAPSADHPGCVYGEMGKCLRPCQDVVGTEEYGSEVHRLVSFFETGGHSLSNVVTAERDRASAELNFEEAARQHARLQRIEQTLKLRDELAGDAFHLNGVAVQPAVQSGAVELFFLLEGAWLPPVEFSVAATGAEVIPLDRRLRELVTALVPARPALQQRAEHLALLAQWFYSSWRDGEWIPFPALDQLSYRKLVRAISKTATSAQASLF